MSVSSYQRKRVDDRIQTHPNVLVNSETHWTWGIVKAGPPTEYGWVAPTTLTRRSNYVTGYFDVCYDYNNVRERGSTGHWPCRPFSKYTVGYDDIGLGPPLSLDYEISYGPLSKSHGLFIGHILPDWSFVSSLVPNLVESRSPGVGTGKYAGTWDEPTVSDSQKAWNKFKPKFSKSSLGVFIGEAKEIPKMMKTSAQGFFEFFRNSYGKKYARKLPRKASDHWLNAQFGWVPFLSDLSSFVQTTLDLKSILDRYKEQNGQWVKRRGVVSSTEDVQTIVNYTNRLAVGISTGFLRKQGSTWMTGNIEKHTIKDLWFSAYFRYYIPSLDLDESDKLARLSNLLRIYGANISPTLVWNLTPWTWLIDWHASVGNIIQHEYEISQYNLASSNACLMQKSSQEYVHTVRLFTVSAGELNLSWRRFCLAKTRRVANPYGFTLSVPSYTARQWSILTALGFTRLRVERGL